MRTVRHVVALGAAFALAAGCLKLPEPAPETSADDVRPGVVLLAQGSAVELPGARERLVALLGELTGRPVRQLAAEPPADAVLKPIAKPERRSLGRYAWREPRCNKKVRPVLTAIAARGDAIYRVRLDATVTTRPATDEDRAKLGRADGAHRLLGAVGIGRADTVFETRIDGTVERTTFPGTATVHRQRVRATERRLGRADDPPPVDLRSAVGGALAAMPPASAARWDGVARWLASSGCPFAAYAVSETLVHDAAEQRRLKAAALLAMQRRSAPEPPPPGEPRPTS